MMKLETTSTGLQFNFFLTGITRRKYAVRVRNESGSLSQDLGFFDCVIRPRWR